jgi:adenine-specific DNA-methyltransferase
MIEDLVNTPKRVETRSLTDYTELLTELYINRTKPEDRKNRGQFFTPKSISGFMIQQFIGLNKMDRIRILDPGAGMGIFESSLCEFLLSAKKTPRVLFDLYENDKNIIPFLKQNMDTCSRSVAERGIEMSYRIYEEDFVLSNSPIFNNRSDLDFDRIGYDFVISNPPYYKLRKESPQAIEMKSIIKGQPNIYALFMAVSARLLRKGGQMTVLTPRSYCSGVNFKNFRKLFFRSVKPVRIHIFESRTKIFKKYNVRQEMMILTAIKTRDVPSSVVISKNDGGFARCDSVEIRKTDFKTIFTENDGDTIMRIPTSKLEERIVAEIDKLEFKLADLGLKVSTGPVVPFRAREYLLNDLIGNHDCIPLIWMQNIMNGRVIWPTLGNGKPVAIENKAGSKRILIVNENYVLIKRFSSKEGKQRISAGVLLKEYLASDYVGIENHVNYIYKVGGKLTENEACGIAELLNSRIYNRYFQIMNGSTQVNAADIYRIPLPSLEKIRLVGRLVCNGEGNDRSKNEKVILEELNIDIKIDS